MAKKETALQYLDREAVRVQKITNPEIHQAELARVTFVAVRKHLREVEKEKNDAQG